MSIKTNFNKGMDDPFKSHLEFFIKKKIIKSLLKIEILNIV